MPNEGTDLNGSRRAISTFNRDYFPSTPVEITNSFLDPEHQVVLLSLFEIQGARPWSTTPCSPAAIEYLSG